jgi:signal transduction histidine kinase
MADERLRDVAGRMGAASADHCVVIDQKRRTVLGLVRLREVALRTNAGNRILADLVSPIIPVTVAPEEPVESVLELVERKGIAEALVIDPDGGYVGLITAESALTWLHGQHRADRREFEQSLSETQRLNLVVERKAEERRDALRSAMDKFQTACLNLSHDVRPPLRSIEEFARMLRTPECGSLNDFGSDCSQRIERSAQKLQSLANGLLDLARDTFSPKPSPGESVDLNQVLDDVLDLHHSDFASRNAVIQKRAALPVVPGRYVPLLQLFSNLISNAVRYVPNDRQPLVEIWCETNRAQVLLYIKDNGSGIPAESRLRVFDPFVRLEPRVYDGSGLGLAIARQAATELGATIAIESEVGEGSTFRVSLGLPTA